MHYYKRNLGDYAKKAGRLSMIQHGSYTLLIDACYDREQFPTLEEAIDWTWASSTTEVEAVEFVLRKFFSLEDGRYVQKRIQEEIAEYHAKALTNSRIALERETKRKEKSTNRARTVDESCESGDEAPPNHKPLTNNQSILVDSVDELDDEIENRIPQTDAERDLGLHISLVAPPKAPVTPACPHDALIDLFGDNLPSLAQPRKSLWMTGKNAPALKARWDWVLTACHESGPRKGTRLATNTEEGLNWFSRFFAHIAKSDFLTGRSSEWACDLIWIVNKSNFEKIIQGTYDQKEKVA